MHIYLNDRAVPEDEAKVSVFDHGFLYGDGVYETMKAYDGIVFRLEGHLHRLRRSASLIGLKLGDTRESLRDKIYELLELNGLKKAYIRLTISRGPGPIGLDPALCRERTLVIMALQEKEYSKAFYSKGVKVMIPEIKRNHPSALNPMIKSLNFLNNVLAKIEAVKSEVFESVMLNVEGFLTEGTISNIFFLKNGILKTPSVQCGILDGITREIVIKLAVKEGLRVEEGMYRPGDIYHAEEVFLTNTTMEVMPVSRVDDASFPVGETAKILRSAYQREVKEYISEVREKGHVFEAE